LERNIINPEFHISREARDRYGIRDTLHTPSGKASKASFHGARLFVRRMHEMAVREGRVEADVRAGSLNALGLINGVFHRIIDLYLEKENPGAFTEVAADLRSAFGQTDLEDLLAKFQDSYPAASAYRGEVPAGLPEKATDRDRIWVELLLLWVVNRNPASEPWAELLDEAPILHRTAYRDVLEALHGWFDGQPRFGPDQENLVDMLLGPAHAEPNSLAGQLEYIRTRWGHLLGDYLALLLRGLDLLREESKWGLPVPGESFVYDYAGLDAEPEGFTPDREWMPNLVLLAKNAHVWLGQLSRAYGRPLRRLDEVPDDELDRLAGCGFTGLWLIGVWERSPASRDIKRMCGNPEALASAYAVHEYEVASDLGGPEAFGNLKARALERGIRMATDMVPNHMGIDSPWVVRHPDRFLQLGESPFHSYRFDTADLSRDPGVGIHLEAHYFDRSDASVVFRRVDRGDGTERFLYHGNDGTSMPWNDTAQLDYLNPETREAVIQEILKVAKTSPVIRFDAAMTLTRRHFQRLWFPEPGSGGAIPTRAERGLSKAEFAARMPAEFWREVVDRVQSEAPDTLLLAEAFWLMEGFFVRTLGMHRVYNSAFMNMLKDEENANYRTVIKNTLEFDPEVLQRFVNFLSNPDEETALAQFGKGDKYFGICTLAATLPGLPLFAHGQIEGFNEKYGMEYGRALWDEDPDPGFVAYHERTIFPLLRKRFLFAGSAHFRLYDFFTANGTVNEDVFAFSNRDGRERALVIYHNRYADTRGWIRSSSAVRDKTGGSGLTSSTLGEGLNLEAGEHSLCVFRDHVTGLQYIRRSRALAEQGLHVELGAYQRHVFLDFREVEDSAQAPYALLEAELGSRGVPDVDLALREMRFRPMVHAFRDLVGADLGRWCGALKAGDEEALEGAPLSLALEAEAERLLDQARVLGAGKAGRPARLKFAETLSALRSLLCDDVASLWAVTVRQVLLALAEALGEGPMAPGRLRDLGLIEVLEQGAPASKDGSGFELLLILLRFSDLLSALAGAEKPEEALLEAVLWDEAGARFLRPHSPEEGGGVDRARWKSLYAALILCGRLEVAGEEERL